MKYFGKMIAPDFKPKDTITEMSEQIMGCDVLDILDNGSNPIGIQRALTFLNFPTGLNGGVIIDGIPGSGTNNGLGMFRCEKKCHADNLLRTLLDSVQNKVKSLSGYHFHFYKDMLDRLTLPKKLFSASEIVKTYGGKIGESQKIKSLKLNTDLIMAIIMVETCGIPSIRFEKHIWKQYSDEPDKHKRRCLSSSFGVFQLMGFNLSDPTELENLADFDKQLLSFTRFVGNNRVLSAELTKDTPSYARIAKSYNGPDYDINRYDKKLANAHKIMKSI